jgi:hypothetical protein
MEVAPVEGGTRGGWQEAMPSFRDEMAARSEYRGRRWDEVHDDLRRHWEERYRDAPWDLAADALRDMWEGLTGDRSA